MQPRVSFAVWTGIATTSVLKVRNRALLFKPPVLIIENAYFLCIVHLVLNLFLFWYKFHDFSASFQCYSWMPEECYRCWYHIYRHISKLVLKICPLVSLRTIDTCSNMHAMENQRGFVAFLLEMRNGKFVIESYNIHFEIIKFSKFSKIFCLGLEVTQCNTT